MDNYNLSQAPIFSFVHRECVSIFHFIKEVVTTLNKYCVCSVKCAPISLMSQLADTIIIQTAIGSQRYANAAAMKKHVSIICLPQSNLFIFGLIA